MLLQIIYSGRLTRAFAEHDELREHAGREQLRRGGTATQVFVFADMDADEKIHARVHALQDALCLGEIAYLVTDDYLRREGSECCKNADIFRIACQDIGKSDIALRASAALGQNNAPARPCTQAVWCLRRQILSRSNS